MLKEQPEYQKILALDFDGVLCNGMAEYFQTSCLVYESIWGNHLNTAEIQHRFYEFRPLIEFGWEMPLMLRIFSENIADDDIWRNWLDIREKTLNQEQITPKELNLKLDQMRDRQIQENLSQWLSLHEFYPNIIPTLKNLHSQGIYPVIITTKDGRFVAQLLQDQGINLEPEQIIGKETQRSKGDSLQILLEKSLPIAFIEDKLSTLIKITHIPALEQIDLYLADWGYNTHKERELTKNHSRIKLLSLDRFSSVNS